MKAIKFFMLMFFFIGAIPQTHAQFLKKLKKHAEEKIKREAEERSKRRIDKSIDKVYDEAEDEIDGKNKRHKDDETKTSKKHGRKKSKSKKNRKSRKAKGKNDFVPGNQVVFYDTFKNDAVGDFPVTWNTNSSGEIVTFDDDDTKWLKLSGKGQFTPDGIKNIPENATLEFDLYVDGNYSFYSSGLWINFVEMKDRKTDFTKWQQFRHGKNGVRLWLHPVAAGGKEGRTSVTSYQNNQKVLENKKQIKNFTSQNNLIHVGIWRQKNRLRVYIDGKKIWDLPHAFGDANYNAVVFNIDNTFKSAETYFYLSNLRLAVAGEDLRKALLETGKFVTNDILFDVNSASIQPASFEILDKIGQILSENPGLKLKIIGHTDSDGSATYNLKLSKKRADAIKEYFITNFNIDAKRLISIGRGEAEPVASNKTKEGKAKNRRVEFIKL